MDTMSGDNTAGDDCGKMKRIVKDKKSKKLL
jgi:hypothetical protein